MTKFNLGAHFLTSKTYRNTPYFKLSNCAGIFCEELEAARVKLGFHVLAFVVMPDHVHLLLWWHTEANPELTISKIAWAVKGRSARRIVKYLKQADADRVNAERVGDGTAVAHPTGTHPDSAVAYPIGTYPHNQLLQPVREPSDRPHYRKWRYKIWQKGAGYDFNIYSYSKLHQKVAYIHNNPVIAGLSPTVKSYTWSSAMFYNGETSKHPVQITSIAEV